MMPGTFLHTSVILTCFSHLSEECWLDITRQKTFSNQLLLQLLFVGCYMEILILHLPGFYQRLEAVYYRNITLKLSLIFLLCRWHSIRKPKLWQVEKSMLHKQVGWTGTPPAAAFFPSVICYCQFVIRNFTCFFIENEKANNVQLEEFGLGF